MTESAFLWLSPGNQHYVFSLFYWCVTAFRTSSYAISFHLFSSYVFQAAYRKALCVNLFFHFTDFLFFSLSSQILSNEEKRSNYDHYGDAGEKQGYQKQQQQREYHFRHFHENFYFDESFFHFPFNSERRDSIDEKYLLHFSHYVNEVVPDSFKKPYLIKITSDWCFSCIHIEPVWKEVVQELEGLGKIILFIGRCLYRRW